MPNDSRSPAFTRSAVRDSIWSGWMEWPVEIDCRIAAAFSSRALRFAPTSYLSASSVAASVSM